MHLADGTGRVCCLQLVAYDLRAWIGATPDDRPQVMPSTIRDTAEYRSAASLQTVVQLIVGSKGIDCPPLLVLLL